MKRESRESMGAGGLSLRMVAVAALLVGMLGCGQDASTGDELDSAQLIGPVIGTWRAELSRLPDAADAEELHHHAHPLPFVIELEADPSGERITGHAVTDEEHVPFSSVTVEKTDDGEVTVVLANAGYDSEITATLNAESGKLSGAWRKTAADGDSRMRFVAEKGRTGRFSSSTRDQLKAQSAARDFGGSWTATFTDDDGDSPARGIFQQQGRYLTGTFRTATGDYRWLEGEVVRAGDDDELRLSTFDGAHAFLFHARFTTPAGDPPRLSGDFFSRDKYHATWTARPLEDGDELPNPFEEVGLTNDEGRFSFAFPDVDGQVLMSDDPRFVGKVTVVDIFGSWCPNCNDSAPFLAELNEQYKDRGLEMVGLAYEMRGDFARDAKLVRRYAERHGIEFPLLVAGTSDKTEAAATLPDLDAVLSFPTKVFIDRRGRVREIYSGYDGPSTGEAHTAMKAAMVEVIETLLAESAG